MKRIICVALLALVGCDDDGGNVDDNPNPGALDNGQRCLDTGAGKNACAGRECVGIARDSQLGVCSELCGSGGTCQHGGECVELEGEIGRVCLAECFDSQDCGDQLTCSPTERVQVCDEETGACAEDLGRFWCLPPLPR